MDVFDKLLFEELVKEYETVDLNKDEELYILYERFSNLNYIEEVKPYLITMKFFGWGTEENQIEAIKELVEIIQKEKKDILKGLFYDLKLKQDVKNKEELLEALQEEEKKGYTNKYLKGKSSLSEYSVARLKELREKSLKYSKLFDAGVTYAVGLDKDGRVWLRGENRGGKYSVSEWNNVKQISANHGSIAALKYDRTVLYAGYLYDEILKSLSKWNDIKEVSVGAWGMIGLKQDGTVISISDKRFGECKTEEWKNIIAISMRYHHMVGLKQDGTVIATGDNQCGQCNVSEWKDIVAISAGREHTLGLTSSGKVLTTEYKGENYFGQCETKDWANIIAVAAGGSFSLGLKADGTVISTQITGEDKEVRDHGQTQVKEWKDIIAIHAGGAFSLGLKADGTFIASGSNQCGQCNVSDLQVEMEE